MDEEKNQADLDRSMHVEGSAHHGKTPFRLGKNCNIEADGLGGFLSGPYTGIHTLETRKQSACRGRDRVSMLRSW